jgi:lysophospholipase L1-like esterase
MRVSRRAAALAGLVLAVGACGAGGTATPGRSTTVAVPAATLARTLGPALASTQAATPTLRPLPGGALTIVALGDSLTAGDCDDSGGYPSRLLSLIEPVRPGSKVTNLGRSGWSSTDVINGQNGEPAELTQAVAAHPAVALVWIGSNDLWNLYEYGPEPMTADAERQDLAAYSANIDKILSTLTGSGAATFIALLDDQSRRPMVASPNPTEPALPATTRADVALMSAHVRAYNDIIRTEAARFGAATVDFYDTTIFTAAATLCDDGNHPNAAGYDMIASAWFAALEPRLG